MRGLSARVCVVCGRAEPKLGRGEARRPRDGKGSKARQGERGGQMRKSWAHTPLCPLQCIRAPCERPLLRDASLVPDLPTYAGRCEESDLGHQLTGPLALAEQEDARVQALAESGGAKGQAVAREMSACL